MGHWSFFLHLLGGWPWRENYCYFKTSIIGQVPGCNFIGRQQEFLHIRLDTIGLEQSLLSTSNIEQVHLGHFGFNFIGRHRECFHI